MAQRQLSQLGSMRMQVRSMASLSRLRIQCCRELWCRLQMQLGSQVAVVAEKAGDCPPQLTPDLGTSICSKCGHKKRKKKKKKVCCRKKARAQKAAGQKAAPPPKAQKGQKAPVQKAPAPKESGKKGREHKRLL